MPRRLKFGVSLLVLLGFPCGGFPQASSARGTRALPVQAALEIRSFGDLNPVEFSPDGKWLTYVVKDGASIRAPEAARSRTGIPSWVTGDDIYVSDTQTGEARNLTLGKGDNWLPSWSPDGRFLAFLSNRDGSEQARIWVWDTRKNQLEKVSDLQVRTNEIIWSGPREVIVTVAAEDRSVEEENTPSGKHIAASGKQDDSTVVLYKSDSVAPNRAASGSSAPWNLDAELCRLVSVDIVSGETSVILKNQRIATYKLSNRGSRIAYSIPMRFARAGSQQILFDMNVVTIGSLRTQLVASTIPLDYDGAEFSWSPDDRLLVYHTGGPDEKLRNCYAVDSGGNGSPQNTTGLSSPERNIRSKASVPLWDEDGNIYFTRDGTLWRSSVERRGTLPIASVAHRRIVQLLRVPRGNLLWRTDGGAATIVVTHDEVEKEDGFYQIDLRNGRSTKLREGHQCFTCENLSTAFAVSEDGQHLAYTAEDAQHAADLWIDDEAFRHTRPMTHLNPQFDGLEMGAARLIRWLGDDGQKLSGALLLPSGFHEGMRCPLVVWVYAGSSLSDHLDRFGLGYGGAVNFQLLATRGYAVLLPDSPQGEGEPMQELAKTVLPGVNKAIELGIADPNRLGVMGQSNGGYSTLALIVQTQRFRAAIEMDGMASLVGLYGEMDKSGAAFGTSLEHGFDAMGGTPWEFRERYIENSPLFYFDRIVTPLLIIHGGTDNAVAPCLGDEVFVALRRLDREVEYAKYGGEGHSQLFWSRANQLDCWNRIITWFEKYLE